MTRELCRIFLVLAGAVAVLDVAVSAEPMLHHVHGLAYSADGKRILVPSHHGLAVYSDGKWSKAPGPQHDYMGFAATKTHIYSSGHPAQGSGLKNPFGLIRSKDGGATWEKLGLEGESDFHLLATGWNTNAVFVWNPEPNSRMPQVGLHYTLNNGFQWRRVTAAGPSGEPRALAVHPADAKTVAVATSAGIYLSNDSGANFRALTRGEQGLAVFFALDGRELWHSTHAGAPRLTRVELQSGKTSTIVLPPLTRDAVSYIAQNPADTANFAIATFERSVFVSRDAGRTWRQIADRGNAR